jgi:hypothetical protein
VIGRVVRRGLCGLALAAIAVPLGAAPLPAKQIAELCREAEDQAHCGRLIEEVQLKRLPGLAKRSGDDLEVTLFPSGKFTFRDTVALTGAKSFALWDYLDHINAVVLFVTDGDAASFLLLQRVSGRQTRLPAEPVLSPDRQRLVTVDVCAAGCDGEVAVWRVGRDAVIKELVWKPQPPWSDAAATWKNEDTLTFDYAVPGDDKRRALERRLADAAWSRPAQP